jgi:hypothetical protein
MFLVGLVLAVCAPLVFADAPLTGVVTGTVVDPNGAPLPGATVQIEGGRGSQTAITKEDGSFLFVFLAPGQYTVRASMESFQTTEGTITVSAGGRAAVDLQLSDAMGGEILVTGETPLVDRYNVTAGGTVTQEELTTIPTTERDMMQALHLLPGTVNTADSNAGSRGYQPDVEGTRGGRVAFHLDGVDVTWPRQGGASRLQLPMFATAEVKIESSGIDAQYSRTIGGVATATIRSGTNQFHGELAWNGRNLDWNENYDLTPVLQPDELVSSWEFGLGGPIIRDKLWFFVGYGDREDPAAEVLFNGDPVDTSIFMEQEIVKLDWRPNATHSFSANYVSSPFQTAGALPVMAELEVTMVADTPGDFISANWNWAASDSLFIELRAALQEQENNFLPAVEPDVDPSADPWKPAGNNHVYRDAATGLFWNATLGANLGKTSFPRDQANLSVNWFSGVHDLKAGLDFQQVEWQAQVQTTDMVIGAGYNPDAPGGFARPFFFREIFNTPPGVTVINPTENWGLYVRDRLSFDRWTFNLGLRFDNQKHENDIGVTVVDADVISPRLSAVYDVKGDSTVLVSATAGRYMYQMPQNWSANFNTIPTGQRAFFRQYGWNPGTQAYDRPMGVRPPLAEDPQVVDPHNKDEFTLGVDWAFDPRWALKAKYVYWEQKDNPSLYSQVNAQGEVITVAEQNPLGESQRNAIHLQVQRRFQNNWMFDASYTWSKTEGTCMETDGGTWGCGAGSLFRGNGVGEYIDQLNPDSGVPWSVENRDGYLPTDRTHMFKVRGLYLLPLGRGHSLNLGAFFFIQSGQPWARIKEEPVLGGRDNVAHFTEPRGNQRNPDMKQLSLNFEWQFPIVKQLNGAIRLDVINATNEQELVGTAGLPETGEPTLITQNYQKPRYFRLMARLTF